MTAVNPSRFSLVEHEIDIRVRYQETDAQGRVHHANYISYFEIGRIEMMRAGGASYRQLEADGIMLVVTHVECNYHTGAKYDDLLALKTILESAKGVRVRHRYELRNKESNELVVEGRSVVASIDHDGKVVRLPAWLRTK